MNEPILDNYKTYIVLHYLYTSIDAVCMHVGDISPLEYALLTEIAEMPEGFPLQNIKRAYANVWGSVETASELLEEKELVERKRLANDRRKFALHATLKGRNRINTVDESLAFSLVDSTTRITEERFEQFATQLHGLQGEEATRIAAGIIPSQPLRLLYLANQYMVQECARVDLSISQFVVMCILMVFPQGLCEEAIGQRLGVSAGASITASVLDGLENRHLIRLADAATITTEGTERAALILDRLRVKILEAFDRISAERREDVVAAVESCLYLFA